MRDREYLNLEGKDPVRKGYLSVPLEGDRDFGELCGSHQGCQVPFRPPIPNVGLLLRETRLPWRPTRGSLTSPSYLVRNRTLGPPLENNPEIPPSSRDEGLRLLHGLATNLATSLQTPQEA